MTAKKKNSRKKNSTSFNTPLEGIFGFPQSMNQQQQLSLPFEMQGAESYYLVSLNRIVLTYAYTLFGPLRTLVDQPVHDAFRGGIHIKTDQLSPEEIEQLEKAIKKTKLQKAVMTALRWDRLFGGAGVIVNTDDQESKKPLDVAALGEDNELEFIAADRWELAWNGVPNTDNATFLYYNKTIHQSRVARIVGEEAPSLAKQRLQGWGMSVIEAVIREMNSYFKHQNVTFEVLDEHKVDVYKIKGFNSAMLQQFAQEKTTKRIDIANKMKSFMNALILDAEDDYIVKNQSFAGLPEILEQIRIGMAAAIRMPMAKIFGLAAKGFASGEDDIENYNAIVENERERAEDALHATVPVLCQKMFGIVPEDLDFEWKPLRVLSAEQEENVKNQKFQRLTQLRSSGHLNPVEYMQALKDEDIFTMETEVGDGLVDPEDNRPMMTEMQDGEEEPGAEGGDAKPSAGKKPAKEDAEGKDAKE